MIMTRRRRSFDVGEQGLSAWMCIEFLSQQREVSQAMFRGGQPMVVDDFMRERGLYYDDRLRVVGNTGGLGLWGRRG